MFYKLNKKISFISTLAVVACLSANVNAEDKLIDSNIKIGVEKKATPKIDIAIEKNEKASPIKIDLKKKTSKVETTEVKKVVETKKVVEAKKAEEKVPAPKLDNDPLALDFDLDLDLENAPVLELEPKLTDSKTEKATSKEVKKVKEIDQKIAKKKEENKNLNNAVKDILANIKNDEQIEDKDSAPVGLLGMNENLIDNLKGTIFSRMSNLEKQNAVLDLELKQEKIKNEIEALKQKRKDAEKQSEEKFKDKDAKRKKLIEEEERKTLVEKQKLAEKELELKKQEEEKKLNAYKLELIQDKNTWIKKYNDIYKLLKKEKATKVEMVNNIQKLLSEVSKTSTKANSEAKKAKAIYEARLKKAKKTEALLRAELKKKNNGNPFATAPTSLVVDSKDKSPASQSYAIMEIRGQGDELVAQLLNKSGKSFYVKSGTLLKTGHVVTEIGKNFVKLGYGKSFETLYFAAGGILDREPEEIKQSKSKKITKNTKRKKVDTNRSYTVSKGVPGMSKGMLVK